MRKRCDRQGGPVAKEAHRTKPHKHGFRKEPASIGRLNGPLVGARTGIGIHGRLIFPETKGGLPEQRRLPKAHGKLASRGVDEVGLSLGRLCPEGACLERSNRGPRERRYRHDPVSIACHRGLARGDDGCSFCARVVGRRG